MCTVGKPLCPLRLPRRGRNVPVLRKTVTSTWSSVWMWKLRELTKIWPLTLSWSLLSASGLQPLLCIGSRCWADCVRTAAPWQWVPQCQRSRVFQWPPVPWVSSRPLDDTEQNASFMDTGMFNKGGAVREVTEQTLLFLSFLFLLKLLHERCYINKMGLHYIGFDKIYSF